MKRIIRLLVLFSLSFTLLSCLSVESEITVKNDGSGTLTLSYRISRMVTEIGRLEDENTLVPLPVNEEDFRRTASENEGITLKSFNIDDDDEYVYIDAELEFSDPAALSVLLGGAAGDTITFSREGDNYILSQRLYDGLEGPISEDSKRLLETYFSSESISCTVRTESAVKDAGIGTAGDGGKEIRFESSVSDIVQSEEPVEFRVTW